MRYTTVIDVTTIRSVWRCNSAAKCYYYLAMKCGYGEEDMDTIRISLRQLSEACGLTLSAVRHAIAVLQLAELIGRDGDLYLVKKWLPEKTAGKHTADGARRMDGRMRRAAAEREREAGQRAEEAAADARRLKRENDIKEGKNDLMRYFERQVERAAGGDTKSATYVRIWQKSYEATADYMRMCHEEFTKTGVVPPVGWLPSDEQTATLTN